MKKQFKNIYNECIKSIRSADLNYIMYSVAGYIASLSLYGIVWFINYLNFNHDQNENNGYNLYNCRIKENNSLNKCRDKLHLNDKVFKDYDLGFPFLFSLVYCLGSLIIYDIYSKKDVQKLSDKNDLDQLPATPTNLLNHESREQQPAESKNEIAPKKFSDSVKANKHLERAKSSTTNSK